MMFEVGGVVILDIVSQRKRPCLPPFKGLRGGNLLRVLSNEGLLEYPARI